MAKVGIPEGVVISSVGEGAVTLEYICTRDQSCALVKRQPAGTLFYVRIGASAPIEGEPGKVFPYGISGSVEVSRPEALKLCLSLLSGTMEGRGARHRLQVYESPTSVGKRKVYRAVYLAC